ncbi:MAG: hypothetical protein ABI635_08420 [Actinomycetota bacterium]
MKWMAGLGLILVGTALAVYSVPFVTFVAFGAFLAGIVMNVYGVALLIRARHRA